MVLGTALLVKLIVRQGQLSVLGEEVMRQLLAEVHDLVSYSGRKGSAVTLFAVFYILARKMMGRQVLVIWRDPDKPYVWNLQSEEFGEGPAGNKA